jgi:ABC-type Fe3+ transport system permease subunit
MKKLFNIGMLTLGFMSLLGLAAVPSSSTLAATTTDEAKAGVKAVGGTGSGNEANDVTKTIQAVINILLFLVGLIAVLMIVIAGFRFVTSNGDANTVSSAKNTIIYAVIGIVIAVMAYAIVNFVLVNIT